jgi:hypothetical protein
LTFIYLQKVDKISCQFYQMIQKNFFFQIGHLGVLLLLLRGVTPNWTCRWNRAQFTINIYKVMTSNPQALDVWIPLFQVDPPFSTKLNFTKFIPPPPLNTCIKHICALRFLGIFALLESVSTRTRKIHIQTLNVTFWFVFRVRCGQTKRRYTTF